MTVSATEREAMRHALELARRGPRGVNPQVGAVLLSPGGEIIAEGWHHGAGTAHAEVDALSKLDRDAARGATAVVTLEPCNHHGRTGPCSEALLAAGVARVVFGADDPNVESSGGAERLAAAGVEVEPHLMRDESLDVIADWLAVQKLGRPHVTVKWAQSLDGRAAAADGTSQWITGPLARADVHRRRAEADAIVVGTGTVLADDPALTARRPDGTLYDHQPAPVVVGRRPLPPDAAVHRHPLPLRRLDATLDAALDALRADGVQRVFVEGGPTLASAFLSAGLVDEVLAYVAPTLIGAGADGADRPALGAIGVDTIADQRRLRVASIEHLGDDLLIVAHPAGTAAGTDDSATADEGES
ncbi:bifunctional diaminohydroxyphosphoribosylaminopyrimidine deaminase/5-amino-6-(5-phosphoribosylamino)uracil reductase RibD [Microbacterium hominis]|uniref:Riboflavin biosynthesis protein RibD n=1 Tax=Microbacterium hominis TaxID=162426 RepID=A0A7D4U8K6_9MICO|nr:bifunctional diaminohydroxyphosphoribosylaminopyrimidine deaminase/5-amino-6-(5-phosphoribosylamino)uracil reductase RibD [Microbacterium hominis]QKJ20086.1 bifunctional diaminohydroxyphosphoribosylaminopyrimidine deaminase/5-amino-6-(5-phosphoribosylamino)uracil reductase RibD [Microbacterium hominis]